MASRLPRCRTCPRCGGRKSLRVARSFLPGTWRQCLDCREQFRPPVSLLVSITALLFGSFLLTSAVMFAGIDTMLTGITAGVGAAFTAWAIWMIVNHATTPVGPLKGFAVEPAAHE
jgi:hypothetical protein